jgi:hypothetical protein
MVALWLVTALLGPPAIHWTGTSTVEAQALVSLGVRHVITEHLLDSDVLDTLAFHRVRLTSHSDVRYLSQTAFQADSQRIRERIEDPFHYYQRYPFYAGHVALEDPSPWVRYAGPGMVWRREGEVTVSETGGWMRHHAFDPIRFQEALGDADVIHVIPDSWLQGESGPLVRVWLRDPTVRISVPAPETGIPPARWHVWVLLSTTTLWCVGFMYMPTYRRSQIRYWVTHPFFVMDVVLRRIRLQAASVLLYLSSALLTGAFLMTAADVMLTEGGREAAITVGIPVHPGALFLLGMSASLLFDGLMIAWLHLAGARVPSLYLWPRHLQYGCVLMLAAIGGGSPIAGSAPVWLAAFPAIWLICFPTAVLDVATSKSGKTIRLLLTTIGPYLVLVGILGWKALTDGWVETVAILMSIR